MTPPIAETFNLYLAYSTIGKSMMEAVVIVVSPKGEASAPKAPLANTAPTVNGIDAPVETAKLTPKGINNPHVPHEDPIK